MSPGVVVVGAGPAGLMAAETLAAAGLAVQVFDAMPTPGRKFLMAGRGGLNLTHSEPLAEFASRYGQRTGEILPWLAACSPDAVRAWAAGLGIDTFVGSSGRVYPVGLKAAPLLRAWLNRLRGLGVTIHLRHRWLGWGTRGDLRFATPAGEREVVARAAVFALGGASWSRLGSDGRWTGLLAARGVPVAPWRPANCGFEVGWSSHFADRFAGQPVKSVRARTAAGQEDWRAGEFVITRHGVEGGLVYALSAPLRDALDTSGQAALVLDLAPGRDLARLAADLARPRGKDSLASHLRRQAGIEGVKAGLLREFGGDLAAQPPAALAAAIKALTVPLRATRPLDEAISSAGGIDFAALDAGLMLRALPGCFVAGEMIDWEAPTGGYLLTACLASGRVAGQGVLAWLS